MILPQPHPFQNEAGWLARSRAAQAEPFVGDTLRWSHRESVLEVVLDRAPCNEIGSQTLQELERLADYLVAGAGGSRAVVILSEQNTGFSAGADLRELSREMAHRLGSPVQRKRDLGQFIDRIHRVFDVLDTVPLPTVSAVHGVCFGGGFELALTTDLIVADRSARFCFPELRLGLIPGFGGIPRLRRDLGNAPIRDLFFTGRSINARRAHELGLVAQVVARGEAQTAARAVATQVSRFEPEVLAQGKRFTKPLPVAELQQEKEIFVRLCTTPAVESALREFVDRQDPFPYLPEAP